MIILTNEITRYHSVRQNVILPWIDCYDEGKDVYLWGIYYHGLTACEYIKIEEQTENPLTFMTIKRPDWMT